MVMGTVVSSMQADSVGVSQERGSVGQAAVVAREARAAVMKVAAALHLMVEEAVAAGSAVQAALLS